MNQIFNTVFFLFLTTSVFADWDGELTRQLKQKTSDFSKKAPLEKKRLYEAAIQDLDREHQFSSIPQVGQAMRDGEVTIDGKSTKLSSLWKKGPLVLTFYRGGWCPYCIIELKAYENLKKDFEGLGARILAVAPETDAEVSKTRTKAKLSFLMGSDKDLAMAQKLALAFTLPEKIQKAYRESGLDLASNQNNLGTELPIPATFVIDQNGIVRFMQADADYRKRADPEEILVMLRFLE